MHCAQSSIYREIEQLLFWAMVIVDRLPKTTSYTELGRKVMLDLEESLDLMDLALHAKEPKDILDLIGALSIRLRDIRTIFRVFRDKSKNIDERDIQEMGEPVKPTARVVTSKQYTFFVDQMHLISKDMKRWRNRFTGEQTSGRSHSANDCDYEAE